MDMSPPSKSRLEIGNLQKDEHISMVEKQKQSVPENISSVPGQVQHEHPGVENVMHPEPIYIDQSYHGSGKLEGKKALITGGDSGIGRSVAVLFAREGADVLVNYLSDREDKDAQETKRLVEQEGQQCVLVRGDLSSSRFCKELMDRMISEFGRIDCLVNNASVQYVCDDLTKLSDEQLHSTFSSNIFSMTYLTREALIHMQDGSTILFSTSVNAFRGHPKLIDYTATKGAILALSRSLAINLASRNIRVNAVAPGPIWTPLIPSSFDEEKVDSFGQKTPLGRPGQPFDAATSYVFFASADSRYITGSTLHPNGGYILNN